MEEKASRVATVGSLLPAAIILAGFVVLPEFFKSKVNTYAETKPFETFEDFYPFYISQHQDDICRRLHFVGTSLLFGFTFFVEPLVFPSLLLGGMTGYSTFFATRAIEHGLIEMASMLGVYIFFMKRFTGTWWKPIVTLVIPYGFAWFGHFFFEKNKPATFIYPLFSLMGDFKLWYEIASFRRAF